MTGHANHILRTSLRRPEPFVFTAKDLHEGGRDDQPDLAWRRPVASLAWPLAAIKLRWKQAVINGPLLSLKAHSTICLCLPKKSCHVGSRTETRNNMSISKKQRARLARSSRFRIFVL